MNRKWELSMGAPPELFMLVVGVHHPQPGYDRYQLPGLWCVHFYRYNGELKIDGESFPIRPGSCSITPPGAVLEYAYDKGPSMHSVAHFRLEAKGAGETLSLPAMQELGGEFDALVGAFDAAVPWRSTQPARASARVWDVLWRLGEMEQQREKASISASHAAIERARQDIEIRLATPLRVEEIAARTGFSHNHFIRLFRAALGCTPSQYIRARRVERAVHLLKDSTLPVKAIAAQCGLGDLQAFNKTIRGELRMSPREVRK